MAVSISFPYFNSFPKSSRVPLSSYYLLNENINLNKIDNVNTYKMGLSDKSSTSQFSLILGHNYGAARLQESKVEYLQKDKNRNLLEEHNKEAKEYLEDYLEKDEDDKEHFPTIEEYDDCVASLDNLFEVRIYDLAIYNITNNLLEQLKK